MKGNTTVQCRYVHAKAQPIGNRKKCHDKPVEFHRQPLLSRSRLTLGKVTVEISIWKISQRDSKEDKT